VTTSLSKGKFAPVLSNVDLHLCCHR